MMNSFKFYFKKCVFILIKIVAVKTKFFRWFVEVFYMTRLFLTVI